MQTKNNVTLFLSVLFTLCSGIADGQEIGANSISIPHTVGEITLDGRIDDWNNAAPLELTSGGLVRGSQWQGPNDLSAYVWLSWDENFLYFAADLRDDDFVGVPENRQIWNSDSLVLTLRFYPQTEKQEILYLMASTKGEIPESLVLIGRGTNFRRQACESLKMAARLRDSLPPIIEGSVAWKDLLGKDTVAPQRLDFNVEVRDFDPKVGVKSISWIPSVTTVSGDVDLGLAVLLKPRELDGMIPQRSLTAFSEHVQMIELPVVVTDNGNNYVRDLDVVDFIVKEGMSEQKIVDLHFETRPITLGILIDSSSSMSNYMKDAREAAINFLDSIREEDRAFVVSFNHNIEVLKDFGGGAEEAKEAINDIEANGGTMLYSALYFSLRKLEFVREKKVLIILSDGKDESQGLVNPYGEEINFQLILEEAKHREVSVYSIAFRLADANAISELATLTRQTGGRLFTPSDVQGLVDAYDQIAEELKSQYLISYISNNRDWDGLWRSIDVSIKDKNYRVRTREGYYAPKR